MSNLYSVGQMNEHANALEQSGWTPEHVKKAAGGSFLKLVRDVLEGRAEISYPDHIIDCDADPFLPNGWKVEDHQRGGQFKFDSAQVQFYLSDSQRKGKVIEGNTLRKELAGKPVLNANVLDYLLAHPHLIPEEWKQDSEGRTRYIFFWGTIYRRSSGSLCVRCLYWIGGRWGWNNGWLGSDWGVSGPAALRAS